MKVSLYYPMWMLDREPAAKAEGEARETATQYVVESATVTYTAPNRGRMFVSVPLRFRKRDLRPIPSLVRGWRMERPE